VSFQDSNAPVSALHKCRVLLRISLNQEVTFLGNEWRPASRQWNYEGQSLGIRRSFWPQVVKVFSGQRCAAFEVAHEVICARSPAGSLLRYCRCRCCQCDQGKNCGLSHCHNKQPSGLAELFAEVAAVGRQALETRMEKRLHRFDKPDAVNHLAEKQLASVRHTMGLEDQAVKDKRANKELREQFVQELLRRPARLWDET
jgi:hypothetical protein